MQEKQTPHLQMAHPSDIPLTPNTFFMVDMENFCTRSSRQDCVQSKEMVEDIKRASKTLILASLAIGISIQFKPKKDNKRDLKIGDDFLLIVIMLTGIVKCLKFMMLAR